MSIITILGIAVAAIVLLAVSVLAGIGFLIAWVIANYHDEGDVYD